KFGSWFAWYFVGGGGGWDIEKISGNELQLCREVVGGWDSENILGNELQLCRGVVGGLGRTDLN
ncbi:MAG: hypothetical protein J5526_06420, partial [Bacteroidales bacterium]|nr:hypothetical protein [Bacteroidales bacterium]